VNRDVVDERGWTLLYAASFLGRATLVGHLIKTGIDVDKSNAAGDTPLLAACREGYKRVVKRLIRGGADVHAANPAGEFPLFAAVIGGDASIVLALLCAGAHLDVNRPVSSAKPLHRACRDGNERIMTCLLGRGAGKNEWDMKGDTPLDVAIVAGQAGAVRLLLEAGADVNGTDSVARTPLDRACNLGRTAIARMLLDAGANKEGTDARGWTPLRHASMANECAIVKLLLNAGADPLNGDPLNIAITAGYTEMALAIAGAISDRLRTRRGELSDARTCIVCRDKPRTVYLRPCGHVALCGGCWDAIERVDPKCPICRGHVSENLAVYIT
jgi:ankyrin repeat protein